MGYLSEFFLFNDGGCAWKDSGIFWHPYLGVKGRARCPLATPGPRQRVSLEVATCEGNIIRVIECIFFVKSWSMTDHKLSSKGNG